METLYVHMYMYIAKGIRIFDFRRVMSGDRIIMCTHSISLDIDLDEIKQPFFIKIIRAISRFGP